MGRTIGILGVLLFLGLVVGYVGIRKYLHSEGFRLLLSEQASHTLGIHGEFSPFRWDGLQVDTGGFEADGPGAMSHVRADNLHTEVGLGAVTHGTWQLRGTNVGRLTAALDLRTGKLAADQANPAAAVEVKKSGWIPSNLELDGLVIQDVSVKADLDSGPATLTGMQVKAEPAGPRKAYRAVIEGGHMKLPWKLVPPVDIDRVKLRYQDQEVFVTESSATVGGHGQVRMEGEWSGVTGHHAFQGTVSDLPCADFLNTDWSKRLTGKATTTFELQGSGAESSAQGKLTITDGVLTALPVLDRLAAYSDTRRFRELHLSEAHTEWSWQHDTTTLSHLVLASEGLIRLEGSIEIRGSVIDGNFRLGLAPGTLASIPGAETEVFLPGENGLNWAPLHITGTLEDPKEDLSDRLMAAAGMRMLEELPETGEKVLKFTKQVIGEDKSKLLDKGVETVGKGVGKTIQEGTKVIDKAGRAVEKAGDIAGAVGNVFNDILGNEPPPKDPPPAGDAKKDPPAK